MSALPAVETTWRPLQWRAPRSTGPSPVPGGGRRTDPTSPGGAGSNDLIADAGSPWSLLLLAAALFAFSWLALVGVAAALRGHPDHVAFAGMNDLLTGCAAIASVVLGTLVMAQWRVASVRTRDLGVGVALVLYGAIVLYAGQQYPVGS